MRNTHQHQRVLEQKIQIIILILKRGPCVQRTPRLSSALWSPARPTCLHFRYWSRCHAVATTTYLFFISATTTYLATMLAASEVENECVGWMNGQINMTCLDPENVTLLYRKTSDISNGISCSPNSKSEKSDIAISRNFKTLESWFLASNQPLRYISQIQGPVSYYWLHQQNS